MVSINRQNIDFNINEIIILVFLEIIQIILFISIFFCKNISIDNKIKEYINNVYDENQKIMFDIKKNITSHILHIRNIIENIEISSFSLLFCLSLCELTSKIILLSLIYSNFATICLNSGINKNIDIPMSILNDSIIVFLHKNENENNLNQIMNENKID